MMDVITTPPLTTVRRRIVCKDRFALCNYATVLRPGFKQSSLHSLQLTQCDYLFYAYENAVENAIAKFYHTGRSCCAFVTLVCLVVSTRQRKRRKLNSIPLWIIFVLRRVQTSCNDDRFRRHYIQVPLTLSRLCISWHQEGSMTSTHIQYCRCCIQLSMRWRRANASAYSRASENRFTTLLYSHTLYKQIIVIFYEYIITKKVKTFLSEHEI